MGSKEKPTKWERGSSDSGGDDRRKVDELSACDGDSRLKPGDTLVDGLYCVEDYVDAGGFGEVYRVCHTRWKMSLAMKKPKREMFHKEEDIELFKKECENWMELNLHPNIVYCYYVRDIKGVPYIFAEFMDGGSLKKYIDEGNGALYKDENGKDKEKEIVLEQILRIAIECAWGLQYAHEKGFIHKDVKPSNLLLTAQGKAKVLTAKVADFGIASASEKIAYPHRGPDTPEDELAIHDGKGFTPAYCSPEQEMREKLTPQTDLWSFALVLLEMFTGVRNKGMSGSVAWRDLDDSEITMRVPMPERLKALLRRCFQLKATERPEFRDVEAELLAIYQAETGRAFPEPKPKPATLTADSFNNRAISYIDLEEPVKAEKCWNKALKANLNSAISLYNQSLHLWKTAKIDDMETVHRLTAIPAKDANYYYYLAKLHLARGDAESAVECVNEAIAAFGKTDDLEKALTEANEMRAKGLDGKCHHTMYDIRGDSVCFSQDGRLALSGDAYGKVTVWDISDDAYGKVAVWDISDDAYGKVAGWDIKKGRCVQSMRGHEKEVRSVCFSPDGRLALSGSDDKTVKVWDIVTGECTRTLKGHKSAVYSVCFSPDGRQALSGSDDKTVKVWDIVTGECACTLERHKKAVYSVCYSPDGRLALSGSSDRTVRIWDIVTGECVGALEGHKKAVYSVCVRSDGSQALSGSLDRTVKLWDMTTKECRRTLKWHTGAVHSVCFCPDGERVLAGDGDAVRVWDLETGACIRSLRGHLLGVKSVFFAPDGKALSGDSGNVKVWSIPVKTMYEFVLSHIQSSEASYRESERFQSLVTEINQLITREEISAALDKLAELRKLEPFISGETCFGIMEKLASYCISGSLNRYVLRTIPNVCEGRIFYWERGNNLVITERAPEYKQNALSSKNREKAEKYGDAYALELWDLATGRYIRPLHGHTGDVLSLFISPDGGKALSGSKDKTVKVWDMTKGECVHTMMIHSEEVKSICFSPDGRLALSGSAEHKMRLWDIATGERICTFEGHSSLFHVMCFSPDGRFVLSGGSYNDTAMIWDIKTGKCVHPLKGHMDSIESVCYSPDGRLALSGSADLTVKLWDVATGTCRRTLEGYANAVTSACFSPDGRRILLKIGSFNCEVKLYELATEKCIQTFGRFKGRVEQVCFSPNGRQIVVTTGSEIFIYNLDYDLAFPGWCDWHEDARPYLDLFLTLHPNNLTDDDFNHKLIPGLQNHGYGWLRPAGVRAKLEEVKNHPLG